MLPKRLIYLLISSLMISIFLLGGLDLATAQTSQPPAIVAFTIDQDTIPLSDAESGLLLTNIHWRTLNMTDKHHLTLETYHLNAWMPVLDADEVLEPIGSHEIAIQHPLNFGKPTYRLSILDEHSTVLDEQIITVEYTESSDDVDPHIEQFQLLDLSDSITEVDHNGRGMVWVQWAVGDRIPGSHLIFEQVTPSSEYELAELSRDVLWIPSVGRGPLSFTLPEPAQDVELRMQLIDTLTDTVLDEEILSVPVSPNVEIGEPPVVVVPTAQPPAATPPPNNDAELISFNVEPNYVGLGDSYTISWNVANADSVWILVQGPLLSKGFMYIYQDTGGNDLPGQGSLTYTTETNPSGQANRTLVYSLFSPVSSNAVTVEFECVNNWLTTPPSNYEDIICPESGETISAAYQSFERGFMIWLVESGSNYFTDSASRIYVFPYSSAIGQGHAYRDTWSDQEITWTETPPEGYYLPQRGFGWLWVNNEQVRNMLGWATGNETGYSAKRQLVMHTTGGPRFMLTRPNGSFIEVYLAYQGDAPLISWSTLQ